MTKGWPGTAKLTGRRVSVILEGSRRRARATEGSVMFSPVIGQNAKRAAVRKALDAHKVYITAQSFSDGAYRARVLVDGEAYWVDEFRLAQLRQGLTPAELELTPAADD
ncbi:hypothetical protein [Mesorhizobium huakuii]|nr:hypothetical protein [Mesorhizobium huakuii]